jgi:hypothetical protein
LCARKKLADAFKEVAGTILAKANYELTKNIKKDKTNSIRLSKKFLQDKNIADDLSFLILRYSLSYYLSGEDNEYPKFKDNKNKYHCLEFFDNFWLPYLEAGVLYKDDIRNLDINLFNALEKHFERHQESEHAAKYIKNKHDRLVYFHCSSFGAKNQHMKLVA